MSIKIFWAATSLGVLLGVSTLRFNSNLFSLLDYHRLCCSQQEFLTSALSSSFAPVVLHYPTILPNTGRKLILNATFPHYMRVLAEDWKKMESRDKKGTHVAQLVELLLGTSTYHARLPESESWLLWSWPFD